MNTVVATIILSIALSLVSIVQLSGAAVDSAKWSNSVKESENLKIFLEATAYMYI